VGAQPLIVGVSVAGDGTSDTPLLLRGVGPALTPLGVPGALADPTITLLRGPQVVASNDNWDGSAALSTMFASVGAFPLQVGSRDAAAVVTVPPGGYTLQLAGNGAASGIGLIEVYQLPGGGVSRTGPRVVNLSTRTHVGTGDAVLVAGFTIGGQTSQTLMLRATGPTLTRFGVSGVLADPELKIFAGQTLLASSGDWNHDAKLAPLFQTLGAFDLFSSLESVVIITLPPGSYTAQLNGAGGQTGTALLEIYEVR
jgi:hypothetical protein